MNKAFTEYKFNNGTKLKNKLVLAPMTTYASNEDLTLSDEEEIYYNSRGKQFGMVITAATAVSKNAQAFENQISIRDSRYLESMKRLAKAIKQGGAKAIVQLHHGGRMNQTGLYPNQEVVAPSAIKANRDYCVTPRELRTSEVYDIMDYFCKATRLAIRAGFDGVELHGANTYLLQQFFSPQSNIRDDEFGGSLERRLRFPLDLTQRVIDIRKELNVPEFIIGYRFSPEELETPGITIEDTLLLVDELAHKEIDYLHVSLGHYKQSSIRELSDKEPIISKLKAIVDNKVPIIGVGKITTNEDIEDAFSYGYDLLSMGFPALADPLLVDHLKNNIETTKVISKESLLPQKLMNKLIVWLEGTKGIYSVK